MTFVLVLILLALLAIWFLMAAISMSLKSIADTLAVKERRERIGAVTADVAPAMKKAWDRYRTLQKVSVWSEEQSAVTAALNDLDETINGGKGLR
jgi:hypothetical protein